MEFELMYITNIPEEAKMAENSGVDIIFIDLEIEGKYERQGHLDTVISKHNLLDIPKVKESIKKSKLLVRVNPMNENSEKEINQVIDYGTDIVMLPMFKTKEEVAKFINIVKKRAEVCLLLETKEAFARIDDILELEGINRIHIGLNDLHLSFGLNFMFECLTNGIVEYLIDKIKKRNIKYGIGGIARIGEGELPAEKILKEYVRLGAQMTILSRTFKKVDESLEKGVRELKQEYNDSLKLDEESLLINKREMKIITNRISKKRRKNVI